MDNERLTIWLGFAKFLLGTFVLGLVTAFINSEIQNREIELKEIEQLGRFIDHALIEDVGVRKRFAHYFSKVTRSDELRLRWQEYYSDVEDEFKETKQKKEEIDKRLASNEEIDPKVRASLQQQASMLEEALKPIPSQKGENILEAQKLLIALGYPIRHLDGIAGVATRAAIKDFQIKHGIAPDGLMGNLTYAALNKERENQIIDAIREKAKFGPDRKLNNKIELIKWTRSETGWGLKESKEFVEQAIDLIQNSINN